MKGLLLKDYYALTKQMKFFILLIIIFACLPGLSVSSFALFYAAMLPITALAYDERSKWDNLAVMMPYTAANIVQSKYILGYIAVMAAGLLSASASIIAGYINHVVLETETYISILIVTCVAVIFQALNLPFMFKFGVEKGRLAFFIFIGACVAVGLVFGNRLMEILSSVSNSPTLVLLIALIVTVVINIISIRVSTVLYKKRAV
ncbi:MAG: ABC-2 transporter permease [Eubacteriales bacterium]|jgi:ABC-2 type transport system permease protein